jgi:hypothetical protein
MGKNLTNLIRESSGCAWTRPFNEKQRWPPRERAKA